MATDGLDTETKPAGNAGADALVEGSDLTNESVETVSAHSALASMQKCFIISTAKAGC